MNQTDNTAVNQPPRDDSDSVTYQRSSPLVIVGYLIRGFAIASTGKLIGLLLKGSGGAVLALYALGTLKMFGVHWSFRLLALCLGVLIVQLAISVFKFWTLRFRWDDKKISTKTGLGSQKILDFDWFNVRSILLTQSPLQRLLKVADISLVTAGSSDNTIEIPYIPYSLALEWENRVKNQTIEQVPSQPDDESSMVDSEVESAEQPGELIHKLSLRDLLRATFANGNVLVDAIFGFVVLGVAYVAYRFVYQILVHAPSVFELDEGPFAILGKQVSATMSDLLANFAAETTSIVEVVQQFTGIAITQHPQGQLFLFISLALIVSVVFYLIRRILYIVGYYSFTLTQQGIHLRSEFGLRTKNRLTIRRDRVQSTSFSTNFIERSLNRGNVELDSVSKDKKLTYRIPYVTSDCADRVLHMVNEERNTPVTVSPFTQRFIPIHVLNLVHDLVISVVLVLSVSLVLIATFIPFTRGLIWPYSLFLVGYAIVATWISWKQDGYTINNDFLLEKKGGIGSWSVKVVPLQKVQRVSIKQSWIQRRSNRSTIRFHSASETLSIRYLNLPTAEEMKRVVERRISGYDDDIVSEEEHETTTDWHSLPKRAVVRRAIGKLLTSIIFFIPLLFGLAFAIHSWFSVSYEVLKLPIVIVWCGLAIWRIVVVCLKIPKYRYGYSDVDFTVKKSFLSRETETVRYSRLQSVSTLNTFIDWLFRLSTLCLDTAEGSVIVRDLDQREAVKLREYISARLLEVSSTGSDSLTMSEQGATSLDSQSITIPADDNEVQATSENENEQIEWRKFAGWRREITTTMLLVLFGLPLALAMFGLPILTFLTLLILAPWLPELSANIDNHLNEGEQLWTIFWIMFSIWAVLALRIGSGPFLDIPFKGYSITPTVLRYRDGWLAQEHQFVPRNRIQSVNVSSTFLDRLFKVRTVEVETSNESITLQYLSEADAEALHKELSDD
ncbi:MAG: PH domain-containing protein [Gammaproteobacteria bacterium]|nr:PH domain-containing protein [Gammaproteobacteria bacterium]MDE0251982.1 PH domain-containing protein [Gammaproteobacteria bacterium]MDE0402910.1 PH domain-containing protein [Gammaproteobacteria bacterium]